RFWDNLCRFLWRLFGCEFKSSLARTGRKGAIYFLLHVTLVVHKIATNAKTCKSERWLMGLSLLAGD
uniref:Uncharacterized protein n=1 Tax=Aegilops tauschii subsp. strangulata TaxID=200361 RepID=A0A452Y1D4_AEGTS